MNRNNAQLIIEELKQHFISKFGEAPSFHLADYTYEDLDPGAWVVYAEGWRGNTAWSHEVRDHFTTPAASFQALNIYTLGVFSA